MKRSIVPYVLCLALVVPLFAGCNEDGTPSRATSSTEYIHVGENWDALYNLQPSEKSFTVRIKGKESYAMGESLSLTVSSEKGGRLWIVQVDPEDEVTPLFPNPMHPDNTIEAHVPLTIPPKDAAWSIEASDPAGKSVVAAIVTAGDADLSDVLAGQKSMAKALRLVEAEPAWGLARVVIDVSDQQ